MAQILLRGQDPIEISDERAREIKNDFANGSLPDVVEIDNLVFNKKELKSISLSHHEKEERNFPYDYSLDELKEIIGDFEKEFLAHSTGKLTHNEVLGTTKEGIVAWAREQKYITKDNRITFKGINEYMRRYRALEELNLRREYADKKDKESLDALAKAKATLYDIPF